MGDIIFFLGGAKSGKTLAALRKTESFPAPRFYLATAEAHDHEMEEKIKKHRAERGPDWRTIEEPLHVPQALKGAPTDAPVLLDCLTLWLSNLMGSSQDCFETAPFLAKLEDLIQSAQSRKGPLIVVSNEVGYGLVPIDAVSRFFRDLSGLSHQLIAKNASEVYLVAAGIAQKLK